MLLSFGVSEKEDRSLKLEFFVFFWKGFPAEMISGTLAPLDCWSLLLGLVVIPPVAPLFSCAMTLAVSIHMAETGYVELYVLCCLEGAGFRGLNVVVL